MKRKLFVTILTALVILGLSTAGAAAQNPDDDLDEPQPVEADEDLDPESVWIGPEGGPDAAGEIGAQAAVGTAFTYQGRLDDGGNPANGDFDFRFRLFDAPAAGGQVGPNQTQTLAVTEGLFVASLNFGSVFTGEALYLDIGVRPAGSPDPYTALSPRQAVSPAPYALTLRPGAEVVGPLLNGPVVTARNTAGAGANSFGLRAETNSGASAGVYARGGNNAAPDLVLGGSSAGSDDGWLVADPFYSGSDLYLASNDAVVIHLDDDGGNEDADFQIVDYDNTTILNLDDDGELSMYDTDGTETVQILPAESSTQGAEVVLRKADGSSGIILDADFVGDGRIETDEMVIHGGSDLAEQFDVRSSQPDLRPRPGLVVSIDANHPGELVVSSRAYERTVAGVISGAGGLETGLMMSQAGSEADGAYPVALTGRVYVYADAANGAIQPGDLLTSADRPGHAMKVTDFERAQGAILGKAMTALPQGQGLVLMLVSLQ